MIVLLIVFSVIASFLWHALWSNFWGASLGATITGFALSMAIAFNYVGWWGKEFFGYVAGAIPLAFIVALLVGGLIRRIRKPVRGQEKYL